jgi:prolyl-tRNA synthetase
MEKVSTPGKKSIEEVAGFLSVAPENCIKTLVVEGEGGGLVALALRGDHELNAVKAERIEGVASPLTLAEPQRVADAIGCETGYVGPVGLDLPLFVDHSAAALSDFVSGANETDAHLTGVNWDRDLPEPTAVDLRNVVNGDRSPGGGGTLSIVRGIEVGHIFQLGDKYSRALNATVLDADGKETAMLMGCYGIGVTRIVGAAIEQNHDENGIIWPAPMSPFDVSMLILNPKKSPEVTEKAEELYQSLSNAGIDVLLDDRDARPGFKFADADLIGIPHRLVLGERGLRDGVVEYRNRRTGDEAKIALGEILPALRERQEAG